MGSGCGREGLQNGIFRETPVQRNCKIPYSERQSVKRVIIKRSGRYVSQVRHTQSTLQPPGGLLFENFSGTEEKREVASRHKFKAAESVSKKAAFQDVYPGGGDPGGRGRRLVGLDRLKGCLFPCTDSPVSLEIPEILCGGGGVRVQSIAIRDNDRSSSIYQDAGSSRRVCQEGDRFIHLSIPRRLLGEGQGKVVLGLQIQGNGSVYAGRGSQNQLGEVGTSSVPGHSPHRPKTYDGFRNSVGAGRSGGGDYTVGQVSPEGDEGVSTAVSQAPGMPEQCHISSGMGQVVFATNPALSPGVLEAQFGNVGRFHSGVEPPKGTPELVEKPKESGEGVAVRAASAESRASDGCQYGRMGSVSSTRGRDERCVVSTGEEETHQLSGDVGSFSGPGLLSRDVDRRRYDTGQKRQHDSGNLYQQAGGDEVLNAVSSDLGTSQLVQGPTSEVVGRLCSRREERVGGPLFKEGASPRVVSVSHSGGEFVSVMGPASDRPLCKPLQCEAAPILLSGGRSERGSQRCSDDELGRSGGVCVSASTSHSKSVAESEKIKNQNDSNSAELGKKTMDVHATGTSHRHSSHSSSKREASKNAQAVGVSSGSTTVKFSCLEDRRKRLREKGFREGTAKLATGDIRGSTESCYDARVRVFISWCHKNGVKNPIGSSLASVCNFLHEIFQEGKAAKTVGGYIAALSKWHHRIHGKKLCDIEEVANIRKATVIARPPRKIDFQSWSLPLVLDSLYQEPYEPMIGAQLKYLTYKTVFLVAVSTARRSSELGALSIDESRFLVRPHGIEVGYVPGFVPKNARMNYAGRTIVIPKFEDAASCEEERLLCPVRAVKCYKKRMDLLRKEGEKRLFVTYGSGEKQGSGASKKTIARWITDTIKFAYANASEDTLRLTCIKAHSVRAASTTYALLKGVEVKHILEAADWATPTTFIDYYFRPGSGPGQAFAASVLKAAGK